MPDDSLTGRRAFPGGARRLPRLDDPVPETPAFAIVGTAFVRDDTAEPTRESAGGFTGYFTFESLFDGPEEPQHVEALAEPYHVLEVTPETPWDQVAARHRKLVKDAHPDLFVTSSPAEQDAAEHRIREINVAFTELRRIHPNGV